VNATETDPPLDITATAVRVLMLYSLLEFQSGHATTIRVTAEGTAFSIADDGRGHSLDRTVEGTSYLKFIYTHFDYPFESGRSAPIQLQGIGISLVNALCSELSLTVRKRDETLQLLFRNGKLHKSNRTAATSGKTGTTISAKLNSHLQKNGVATKPLEDWLQGLLVSDPTLKLYFNARELQSPVQV
jgi:DNA gyrase/topoisomerase IV subunit B